MIAGHCRWTPQSLSTSNHGCFWNSWGTSAPSRFPENSTNGLVEILGPTISQPLLVRIMVVILRYILLDRCSGITRLTICRFPEIWLPQTSNYFPIDYKQLWMIFGVPLLSETSILYSNTCQNDTPRSAGLSSRFPKRFPKRLQAGFPYEVALNFAHLGLKCTEYQEEPLELPVKHPGSQAFGGHHLATKLGMGHYWVNMPWIPLCL